MTTHDLELRVAWQRHVAPAIDVLDALLARHRAPDRRYHGVGHVGWVVRHVRTLAADEVVEDLGAVVAAAFYHDAVYAPGAADNEHASAVLARHDLEGLGWTPRRAGAVAAMIEGTARHVDPPDTDTAVLFDADLAVLGADPAGYAEYVTGVRAEYGHLDDATWRAGRSAVLEGFLARASIYATAAGIERWEHRARANIAAELAALSAR